VDELIEQFIEIREYLMCQISQMIEVYFTGMWDPCMKFVIIKETNIILDKLIEQEYPEFPKKYYPKVKFRIFEDEHEIEAGVQMYLNKQPNLTFLGTSELGDSPFDFYLRKSWDPSCEYMFFARYGHTADNIYSGAKVAAAEYFQGAMTPLSVAFGMAVEDGFIA